MIPRSTSLEINFWCHLQFLGTRWENRLATHRDWVYTWQCCSTEGSSFLLRQALTSLAGCHRLLSKKHTLSFSLAFHNFQTSGVKPQKQNWRPLQFWRVWALPPPLCFLLDQQLKLGLLQSIKENSHRFHIFWFAKDSNDFSTPTTKEKSWHK